MPTFATLQRQLKSRFDAARKRATIARVITRDDRVLILHRISIFASDEFEHRV
jgi:hypothetical protein